MKSKSCVVEDATGRWASIYKGSVASDNRIAKEIKEIWGNRMVGKVWRGLCRRCQTLCWARKPH